MTVGSKIRMIPTFFVVIAAAAAIFILLPQLFQPSGFGKDRKAVVVKITFEPDERSRTPKAGRQFADVVVVQITVAGQMGDKEYATASPWVQPLYPNEGEKVAVHAEQLHGQNLTCQITQGEVQGPVKFVTGPGAVDCVHITA